MINISGKDTGITYVDKKGKRVDGRAVDELRLIKITAGGLDNAAGSCYLEWGQNKTIVGVMGPSEAMPKHIANPLKSVVHFQYRMAGFSVTEHKNPRPGRREVEISKVIGEALENSILIEKYPNTMINIFGEIFDSNAGTRIAALTAASVAVAEAGIPMRDMISGCAIGKAGGHLIADLNKTEEDAPDAVDMAFACLPTLREVVLLQMDGILTLDEFKELIKKGFNACDKVHALQKQALITKYSDGAEKDEPKKVSKKKKVEVVEEEINEGEDNE